MIRFGQVTALVVAMAIMACGGGDDEDGGSTSAPSSAGASGATSGAQGSSSIEGFEDVQAAVIQIVAQGSFRDPEIGYSTSSGAGSGFIISPDGLAVTNNHVVAGAATLEVFVGGDDSRSYNATILGVSECNDLALIDIRESSPFPYLEWYEDEIVPGIDVYAAGFPLGDPQYTLTRGIVSKSKADGDVTGTSSIDHTIEHDANIQPGNSGGPLISTDGRVVAVNYAGADFTNTSQFFAIASGLAQPVIEELRKGDHESLGINGWAVTDESLGLTGIWVAGVGAGTPASRAGILPGDIVTSMNGLPMGVDGTMGDYCDVIRTAGSANAIAVEVLRYDTGEILRGELNGDQPLAPAFSPAAEVQTEVDATDIENEGGPAAYSGYYEVSDDTVTIFVEIPNEWSEVTTEPFERDGESIPYITASHDLEAFYATYDTSGMEFALFGPVASLEDTVDSFAPGEGECQDLGYFDFDDSLYTGVYRVWDNCGGTGAIFVVLAAVPDDASFTAVMLVQLTVEADWEALDRIFATFDAFPF